jgi:transposase
MRIAQLAPHATDEILMQYMRQARTVVEYTRWHAIYLTSLGLTAETIAQYTCTPVRTIEWWRYVYNHGSSAEAFALSGSGGRRHAYMTVAQENEFLKQHTAAAKKGAIVIASTIQSAWNSELKKKVSLDAVYDLLHRHGWRKVEPEHHHPKHDPAAQEDFKKNSLRSSLKRWVPDPHLQTSQYR